MIALRRALWKSLWGHFKCMQAASVKMSLLGLISATAVAHEPPLWQFHCRPQVSRLLDPNSSPPSGALASSPIPHSVTTKLFAYCHPPQWWQSCAAHTDDSYCPCDWAFSGFGPTDFLPSFFLFFLLSLFHFNFSLSCFPILFSSVRLNCTVVRCGPLCPNENGERDKQKSVHIRRDQFMPIQMTVDKSVNKLSLCPIWKREWGTT